MAPRVMTVTGPIPPERVGFTLPHEHTGIHLWHIPDRSDYWELAGDELTLAEELGDFRRRGGSTLVDMTLPGVGRDPERLRRLATRSGVQVVMGCGWYRGAYYPAEALIDRRSVDDLAAELIAEFSDGVAGTGVRPGIIGEIGTDKPWVSALEERVHRAAARASLATGMAISTHAILSPVGLAQLRIFTDEGDAQPVTVLDVSDNRITQIKTADKDGYTAVQLGAAIFAMRDRRRLRRVLAPAKKSTPLLLRLLERRDDRVAHNRVRRFV